MLQQAAERLGEEFQTMTIPPDAECDAIEADLALWRRMLAASIEAGEAKDVKRAVGLLIRGEKSLQAARMDAGHYLGKEEMLSLLRAKCEELIQSAKSRFNSDEEYAAFVDRFLESRDYELITPQISKSAD